MRPVTPSSHCLASYRLLPFLRAVFQSLARAIFTDAELGERLYRYSEKSTATDTAAASSPFDYDSLLWQEAFAKGFDGREKFDAR